MTNESKYPFQLKEVFFVSLSFSRGNKLTELLQIPVTVEVKYIEPGFPIVQLNMKIGSPEDSLVRFNTEVIGLFEYTQSEETYNKDTARTFAFELGYFMLWPSCSQMIRMITSQMGMSPLQVPPPPEFNIQDDDKAAS